MDLYILLDSIDRLQYLLVAGFKYNLLLHSHIFLLYRHNTLCTKMPVPILIFQICMFVEYH